MRTLLAAFAAISVLVPVAIRLGPVWSIALGWLGLLVVAHVVGNAWGTRATQESAQRANEEPEHELPTAPTGPIRYAPPTRLERSTRHGWLTLGLTALGVVSGAVLGAVLLIAIYGESRAYVGIALGIVSAAALGGFFGFLTATSLGSTYRAWHEASRHDRHPPR